MRTPLRHCDTCRWCEMKDKGMVCAHAHTPAFIVPGWEEISSGEWGWLRRCKDYKPDDAELERLKEQADAKAEAKRQEQRRLWRVAAGQGFDTVKRILPASAL